MTKIDTVKAFVFRYPLLKPVITSFGIMNDRPMVLVCISDKDGQKGWGEVWCNFPLIGAEHRARLIDNVFSPLLENKLIENPEKTFDDLTESTNVLSIQSGENGPISQCIAGIDIALHDFLAKKENVPIWKKFGGKNNKVPIYASGINPTDPVSVVQKELNKGITAFKLKIGFGLDKDLKNIEAVKNIISKNNLLMVDANQAWNLSQAIDQAKMLENFDLNWLEEAIPANSPLENWKKLKANIKIPLAAGENFFSDETFNGFMNMNLFSILQPDLAKWGGFTKCISLSKRIVSTGINFCPHFLGGGIGLIASAHLLSASSSKGLLEVDCNPNPLRSDLVGNMLNLNPGFATLSDKPGLGYEPDLNKINKYLVAH